MQIITDLDALDAKITECNDTLARYGDDAMRRLFQGFRFELASLLPPDPFSPEYRDAVLAVHARITGKPYSLVNERTLFDVAAYRDRPFPYNSGSPTTAGHHLGPIGFMLRTLDIAPGARVVEFGPGWGNSTLALALLGMQVTAVDIEPNFCQLLRDRAAQAHVALEVVEADFFWAETVTEPYDAAIFFECFHHCDDHLRLLRALRRAVKPGGIVVIASEPINAGFPVPWGVRADGESLWAMRNFGWLELGFNERYFDVAMARSGWVTQKHLCADADWTSVWVARQAAPRDAPWPPPPGPPDPAPGPTEAARLAVELAAVYGSTSWKATAPLRALRRLMARPGP